MLSGLWKKLGIHNMYYTTKVHNMIFSYLVSLLIPWLREVCYMHFFYLCLNQECNYFQCLFHISNISVPNDVSLLHSPPHMDSNPQRINGWNDLDIEALQISLQTALPGVAGEDKMAERLRQLILVVKIPCWSSLQNSLICVVATRCCMCDCIWLQVTAYTVCVIVNIGFKCTSPVMLQPFDECRMS